MYGPRCVVVLWLVVPSSDWFRCGQPPLRPVYLSRHLKCVVSARSQLSCVTALALIGAPCCGVSISTLPFVAAPLVRASLPGGTWGPHSLSRCGVPTRLVATYSGAFVRTPRLTIGPGFQSLAFCSGGYFSPASELDASGTLAMVLLFFAGVNTHGFDIPHVGVCNHAYRPTTVKVSRLPMKAGELPLLMLPLISLGLLWAKRGKLQVFMRGYLRWRTAR